MNELATLETAMFSKSKDIAKKAVSIEDAMFPMQKSSPRAIAPSSKMTFGKAVLTPAIASKVLGVPEGMTPGDQFRDMYDVNKGAPVKMSYPERFGHSLAVNLGGEAMDMATSPINYAIGPALKYGGPVVKKAAGNLFKGAQGSARKGAISIAQNILRPKGKLTPIGDKVAEAALKEKVLSSFVSDVPEKTQKVITKLMTNVDDIAAHSDKTIPTKNLFGRMGAQSRVYRSAGAPERAEKVKQIAFNIAEGSGLIKTPEVSVKRALGLRRSQDALLKELRAEGGYGAKTMSPEIAARQAFTEGARKAYGIAEPEIANLNRRISGLINVQKAAKSRAGVAGRNDQMDMKDVLFGMAGATGKGFKSWAPFIAKQAWKGTKGSVAQALYDFSNIGQKTISKAPFGKARKLLPDLTNN